MKGLYHKPGIAHKKRVHKNLAWQRTRSQKATRQTCEVCGVKARAGLCREHQTEPADVV